MQLKITSIYDAKAKTYTAPKLMKTEGEALRAFISECNHEQSQINKWPEDFSLWILGEMDLSTGNITPFQKHECVGKAHELIEDKPQMPLLNKNDLDSERVVTQ